MTRGELDQGVTGTCVPVFSPAGTVASLGVACLEDIDAVGIGRTKALLAASVSEILPILK
jgi:DNA-binding IclR family transcriptional regulator